MASPTTPTPPAAGPEPEPWSAADFRPVGALLQSRRRSPLPPHRLGLVQARLRARLQERGIPSFSWFHDRVLRLRPDGAGMQMLLDLSTVNHSCFFREPGSLSFLAEQLTARLRGGPPGPVRAWSAGCSAGQEPYSLAMALVERSPGLAADRLELLASDVSMEMLRAGARAIYEGRELADVSPDRLRRFFLRGRGPRGGSYRVVPEVRRLVTFRHFDLHLPDWPVAGEFDAILCRNVAIYFAEDERPTLLDRLAGRLRPGGWLVVGNSEVLPAPPASLRKHAPSVYRKAAPP